MSNAFIDKLSEFAALSKEDVDILVSICRNPQSFPAHHDLVREGDKAGAMFIILEGWACRYKLLPEGTRQITAFLMPGDWCDTHASIPHEMEHAISTLTAAKVAIVPRTRLDELILTRPVLARGFRWSQLVDEDTLRAWIVSLGRRDSVQRVAHLMCELYVRARNVFLTYGEGFELPLTQIVIGDALGLTPVHINRVLSKLRLSGLMSLANGNLIIRNMNNLARFAGFDESYLHHRRGPIEGGVRQPHSSLFSATPQSAASGTLQRMGINLS